MLPVAILSGIALYGLRQDKTSLEREARERAAAIAPDLASRVAQRAGEIAASRPARIEGAISAGRIVLPPNYDPLPVPPEWPGQLPPAQVRLHETAQQALFARKDPAAARKATAELKRTATSPDARANAEFGLLLMDSAPPGKLLDFARRSTGVLTESGAPLAAIALLAALRASRPGRLPEAFSAELDRQVNRQPSFLTPELLAEAERVAGEPGIRPLRAEWAAAENTRGLLRELLRTAPAAGEAWVERDGEPFLALSAPAGKSRKVAFVSVAQVEEIFRTALAPERGKLPAWAGTAIELAGRQWPRSEVNLASAASRFKLASPHPFRLHITLANPEALYRGYSRSVWLSAALIFTAAATALLGLVNLWRSLRRQARLNEMQSNFVSSVSHELRAPIGAVRLLAENLERGKVEEAKQKEYLGLIVQECGRLSTLVENVLDFSRMESGRKQYTFAPVDLMPLVEQTVTLMAPYAAERQVNLAVVPPANGSTALRPSWDRHAVEQSLVNLLDNSIKHSPAGAAVQVEVELAPPGALRIWVADCGPGIPPEEQSRIFDLFYRHGSELRRETKGAGIGLSIVKHVAEAHGGRVLVESAPGKGSRFALELPLEPHHA